MTWADWIFAVGEFAMVLDLVPALLAKEDSPTLRTTILMIVVQLLFTIAYVFLGLWLAFGVGILSLICWISLFWIGE